METNIFNVVAVEKLRFSFATDEKKLLQWLESLATAQSFPASAQILELVQTVNSLQLKPETKIKFLLHIYNFLPVIVTVLQKSYLDQSLPLNTDVQLKVERVIKLYFEIALALWVNLETHPSAGKELHVLTLHLSFDSLAQTLLHSSFSYHQVPQGFWQHCYTLYAYAEQSKLLPITCKYPVPDQQSPPAIPLSIESKFKYLVLFHLCDTQQFRAREQQIIFRHLLDFAHNAKIYPTCQQEMQTGMYTFNLLSDQGPHKILTTETAPEKHIRFCYCLRAAKAMHDSIRQLSTTSTLDKSQHEAILKAASTLGLVRKRKFTRVKKNIQHPGIIGFNPILDYLRSRNSDLVNKVSSTETSSIFQPKASSKFDLVPLGEEVAHQMRTTLTQPETQNSSLGRILSVSNLNNDAALNASLLNNPGLCELAILDSSVKGYGLMTQNQDVDVKIGDILGLVDRGTQNLEISLIRRINQLDDNALRIGVEVLSFQTQLVYVCRRYQTQQGIWALLIPEIDSLNQPSSLIYNGSLLKPNDTIQVESVAGVSHYQLQKTLTTTPAITWVQLEAIVGE